MIFFCLVEFLSLFHNFIGHKWALVTRVSHKLWWQDKPKPLNITKYDQRVGSIDAWQIWNPHKVVWHLHKSDKDPLPMYFTCPNTMTLCQKAGMDPTLKPIPLPSFFELSLLKTIFVLRNAKFELKDLDFVYWWYLSMKQCSLFCLLSLRLPNHHTSCHPLDIFRKLSMRRGALTLFDTIWSYHVEAINYWTIFLMKNK
jgi:hypothetical protein